MSVKQPDIQLPNSLGISLAPTVAEYAAAMRAKGMIEYKRADGTIDKNWQTDLTSILARTTNKQTINPVTDSNNVVIGWWYQS